VVPDRAPTDVLAMGVSPTRIDVQWTNNATTATAGPMGGNGRWDLSRIERAILNHPWGEGYRSRAVAPITGLFCRER
jgi:hypothetical protein